MKKNAASFETFFISKRHTTSTIKHTFSFITKIILWIWKTLFLDFFTGHGMLRSDFFYPHPSPISVCGCVITEVHSGVTETFVWCWHVDLEEPGLIRIHPRAPLPSPSRQSLENKQLQVSRRLTALRPSGLLESGMFTLTRDPGRSSAKAPGSRQADGARVTHQTVVDYRPSCRGLHSNWKHISEPG